MKLLSDSIEAGARLLKTKGPTFDTHWSDGIGCAIAGMIGRVPTQQEVAAFYHCRDWCARFGTDLELWLRLTVYHKYTWAVVIKKLREYNQ